MATNVYPALKSEGSNVKKFLIEQLQAVGVYLIAAPLSFAALYGLVWIVGKLLD